MDANTIIELNGLDYIITQKVVYNKTNYYMVAELKDQKVQNTFGLLRERVQNGKVLLDSVEEKNEQLAVYKLLIKDLCKDIEKVDLKNFIQLGEIVTINKREYALLDYIPMAKKIYMVFMTISKPVDIVIARRDVDASGKMRIVDVTALDEGIKVLRLFSLIHSEEEEDQ